MKTSIRVSRVFRSEAGGFTNYSFGGFYMGQFGITTIIQFEGGKLKTGFNFHVAGKQLLGGLVEFKTRQQENFHLYINARKEKINKAVSEAIREYKNSNLEYTRIVLSSGVMASEDLNYNHSENSYIVITDRNDADHPLYIGVGILREDLTGLKEKVLSLITKNFPVNPFLSGLEKDIQDNTTAVKHEITSEDFLPNLDDNYTEEKTQAVSSTPDGDDRNVLLCQTCNEIFTGFFKNCPFCNSPYLTAKEEDLPVLPSLDLQLFASGNFNQSAPTHILYTVESEEYILRSFFDRPIHNNCKNSRPDYVRHGGKNQDYLYIAGPFWGKQSASDILALSDYLLSLLNHWEEDLLRVTFNCSEKGNCNSYDVSFGKKHDASCLGGRMEKIFNSCIRHDGMMKKLKKVLEAKGIVLFKDWADFGRSSQKMVWWIER